MDITNWFKTTVKIKQHSFPRYFVFEDIGKVNVIYNIDSLNDYNIIGKIKLKWNNSPLKILKRKNMDNKNYKRQTIYNFHHLPILKSNLQKSIRRSNIDNALKTAYQMLLIDPNSILRRLPIIYIEDVELDKNFVVIVWYMIAVSKKYCLTRTDFKWILGVVHNLATCCNKEKFEPSNLSKIDNHVEFIKNTKGIYYQNNKNNYWALILRYLYGGMKGDLNLLIDCLYTYKNKEIIDKKINLIKISRVKSFSKENILLESIDYHCTNILQNLMKKLGVDSNQEILFRECIWYNRSSITNKESNYKKIHVELYRCIKRYLDDISREIIDCKFG